MISVGVVNADQMLLDGMTAWLRLVHDVQVSATARTVDELLRNLGISLDVVVLGLRLADRSDPLDNLRRLLAADSKVLAIDNLPDSNLSRQVLAAGASACLTRDDDLDSLVEAIRSIADGDLGQVERRPNLAPQERAVLIAYASGLTLAAAARQIGVQPVTAKNYLARVKEKYRQAGRPTFTKLDLAARVREDGL